MKEYNPALYLKLHGGKDALGLAALSAGGVTLVSVTMYEVINILTQFRCGATLRKMSKEQKATAQNLAPHKTRKNVVFYSTTPFWSLNYIQESEPVKRLLMKNYNAIRTPRCIA